MRRYPFRASPGRFWSITEAADRLMAYVPEEGAKGWSTVNVNGEKCLFTYCRSGADGWIYGAIVPRKQLLDYLNPVKVSMILLITAVTLAAALASAFVAERLTNPIAKAGRVLGRKEKDPYVKGIYQLDMEKMMILMVGDWESKSRAQTEAELFVRGILDTVRQNVFFSLSVGGDLTENAVKIPRGITHAQRALRVEKNIFGKNSVQWYERLKQYQGKAPEGETPITFEEGKREENAKNQMEEIQGFIAENYSNSQLSLSMVADAFYITEFYLSRVFKEETGQNFFKYVESLRLETAAELLKRGILVNDAALRVGYNSSQVFRRAWKRRYGTTPSETKG